VIVCLRTVSVATPSSPFGGSSDQYLGAAEVGVAKLRCEGGALFVQLDGLFCCTMP